MSLPSPTINLPAGPPPTAPVLGQVQGQRPQRKPAMPTFLGSMAVPGNASGNYGGKTLLGT